MKKRMWALLFVVICLLLPCMGTSAKGYQENTQFDISVSYGYENTVKIGRDAAFHITVHNLGEAFEGTLKLMTAAYEEEGYYVSSSSISLPFSSPSTIRYYDNYGLSKALKLETDETKTESFEIPFTSSAPYIKVVLEEPDGTVKGEKVIQLSVLSASAEIMVGVLTDYPEWMQYMDGVHLKEYSNVTTSLVMQNARNLERTVYGLDMLDVIIVQDFNRERLDDGQKEALRQWVSRGGILVMGGETGNIAAEEINPEDYAAPDFGKATKEFYGDGQILIYTGSLACAPGGRSSEYADMVDKLFMEIYSVEKLNSLDSGSSYFSSEEYWEVMNRVSSIDRENIPGMIGYVLVLSVYVVLAGPAVYLVLKHFHIRKYIWGCVGVLAVAFSSVIFFMGSSTRFNAPFLNYVRTIRLNAEYEDERVEFGVRAPYNEDYSIYVNKDYDIMPVSEIGFYNVRDVSQGDFSRQTVGIVYGEEENRLDIAGGRAFTEKYFTAKRSQKTGESYGISGTVNFFDGAVGGTVENNTEYDLTDTFLFFRNHMIYIGDFPAGSSKDLSEPELYFFAPGYGYYIVETAMGSDENYVRDITEEFLDTSWKKSLIYDYIDQGYNKDEQPCRLVGFTEDGQLELMEDSAYKMYGQTMVCAEVELSLCREKDGQIWRYDPFVTGTAQAVSGNYDAYDNVYYSREVVLKYEIPENLTDVELSFDREDYFDMEYNKEFGGSIEIYNYKSGVYEKVPEDQVVRWKQMRNYISDNGELMIKYERKSDVQDKEEKLPLIIIKGRDA